ncbi:MAG: hypothetical protein ACRCSP_00600 [Rhodoglobus sp.]
MRVTAAQHPLAPAGADRIFTTPRAVVMLDGATALLPSQTSVAEYVEALGADLVTSLEREPLIRLDDALASAIARAATRHGLDRDQAPSSTVAVVRVRPDRSTDILVLGDTEVVTLKGTIRDDRLDHIARGERAAYRNRLQDGYGYDAEHAARLATLRRAQIRYRNQADGYWIAATDPNAARHALIRRLPPDTPWLALMTDGAYRTLGHLGLDDWPCLTQLDDRQLHELLAECHRWEEEDDPHGLALVRAKRHDDKSIAVVHL